MRRKLYQIALYIWILLIFVMILLPKKSLITKPRFIIEIPNIDKAVHIFLFAVFTFLLVNVLSFRYAAKKKLITISIIIALVLGLFTECLQGFLEKYIERTFSLFDALADLLGACLALIIYFFTKKK